MLKKLLSEGEATNFDLWVVYYHFLLSVQAIVKERLQAKLGPDLQIDSWIESVNNFFSKTGQMTEEVSDGPLIEEIYFNVQNHVSKARICFLSANTVKPQIELVKDKGQPNYPRLKDEFCNTANVLSGEMAQVMAEWLQWGRVSDPVLFDKFKH